MITPSEKLYPVFAPNLLRMIYDVYETDENEKVYTKEIMGIPVCGYDLEKHGCMTISGVMDEDREFYTFDEICNMENVTYKIQKYDDTLGKNPGDEKYIAQYFGKGFDMRDVYIARICASVFIFYGAELILCKKYLKEIADELNSNLYLYLDCVDILTILPERALLSEKGIINFFAELKYFENLSSREKDFEFCNKVFYYDRVKNDYKEIISKYRKIEFEL